MSKRSADLQMAKDQNDDYHDDHQGPSGFNKASTSVMSRRKIIQPKGRNFQFKSNDKPIAKPSSTISFGVGNPSPAKTTDDNPDKLIQFKALNEKFIETLNNYDGVVNFKPLFEKYNEFWSKIDNNEIPSLSDSSKPVVGSTEPITVDSDSDSDSEPEEKKEIKIQGPKFELSSKPTIKNSPFTFGEKKAKPQDDSDSESEVEIKGPTFQFNKVIKDDVFKVSADKASDTSEANNKPSDEKPSDKPVFSFGNQSVDTNKPAFSFGKSEDKPESAKPAFSFGSTAASDKSSDKPAFSFGSSNTVTTDKQADKPAFSFGSSGTDKSDKPDDKPADKPVFSFNSKPEGSSKPAFSFGANNNDAGKDDKPLFSFGTKPAETEATSKPAFSFGSTESNPSTTDKSSDKPAFSFGSSETSVPAAAGFSFKPPSDSGKPSFSFGKSSTDGNDKPASTTSGFSFNVGSNTDEAKNDKSTNDKSVNNDKPLFSFNSKPDESNKPASAFSFTANPFNSETSAKPTGGFSFSSNNNNNNNNNNNDNASDNKNDKPAFSFGSTTDKPAFSFGSTTDKPAFSFGSTTNTTLANPSNKEEAKVEQSDDKVEEAEVEGNFKPIAKMDQKVEQTNENETVQYTKRTKLMLFDKSANPPYVSKGLGELKILTNNDTSKSRVLIRADGGLRVLLNYGIQKDFNYDTIGDGLVRFPTVNTDKQLETFVFRVKTKADGEELLSKLNEFKS